MTIHASTRAFPERPSVLATGLAGASVTTAAVIGILLGLGHRYSTLWRPLNAVAHLILGSRADDVWGFELDVTVVGVGVVLVMSALAGIATAWLAPSRRGVPIASAALLVSVASYFVHLHLVARMPGGLATLLSVGELRAVYTTAAIALVVGMRYAFSQNTEAAQE